MADQVTRAFVCGHPIGHSRSPLIHGHWLAKYSINGSYERVDVAPEDFATFLEKLSSRYAGGNITIPHKEEAHRLVARLDDAAEAIGAVNTLWFEDGLLVGGNTDAEGFSANLDAELPDWDKGQIATVLGAGGAALAIVYALQTRGFKEIRIVNRTISRAQKLAHRFKGRTSAYGWNELSELLDDTDLLVNTTSIGMAGSTDNMIDLAPLAPSSIVTDIVYTPLKTRLLKEAEARKLQIVDGLGMLLHQAVPGFERWFGVRPDVTPDLRAKIIADLEAGN